MVSVDYSIIAMTYDVASFRAVKQIDGKLLEIAANRAHVRVLDLACGTGSYIKSQSHFIENAEFVGIDKSVAMLSEARKKGIVTLVIADVDDGIPLRDRSVDYIVCRYGFHHFTNKLFVLREVARCLRFHGVLNMLDVDPHSNSAWWVYTIFPEVAAIDRQRFMKREELFSCLKSLGFEVSD